jgi:DnaJ domain
MTIASVLLQTICPALLPPADAVDFEYYAVLGLEKPKNILNPWAHLSNNGKGHNSDKNEKSKSKSKSNCPTVTEIRKAYKLVSLQWHPDKVAQRNHGNATHAAALYERVQEAAAVLTDDVQRQLYHDYRCSVARYRFVSSNAAASGSSSWPPHSSAVWDNLAAASWTDKTRLLLLTLILILLFLLQPILVATKINHEHQSTNDSSSSDQHQPAPLSTVPWTILLIPTWMAGALYVVGTGLVAWVLVPRAWRATSHKAVALLTSEAPLLAALAWLQTVAVGIGLILLARAWDQNDTTDGGHDNDNDDNNDTNWWTTLAAPCYVVLALSLGRQVHQVHIWRRAMGLMHSVEYIQQTEGISASDWSLVYQPDHDDNDEDDDDNDEEQQQLDATTTDYKAQRKKVAATYIVVHANPALVAQILEAIRTETNATVDPMSNDMEAIRVQSSLEFQTLDRALQATFRSMGILALIGIPLATLIVLKANGTLDRSSTSWWVVFCPLWIRLGLPWIRHSLIYCCSGGSELEEDDDDDKEETTMDENETKKDEIETKSDAMEQADKAPFANASGMANTDTNDGEDATANEPSPLRQLHRQSDVPDDEALWASPEGDISEFNAASPKATTLRSSSSSSTTDATNHTGGIKAAAPSGSTPQPNDQDEKAAAKPQSNSSGGDDDDDDDEPDEDFEEMFRQYQQHLHQDDENERMQEKLNALSSCSLLSFQLLLLCLVVAKLEHDSDGDTTAFNAFWVLFPIFVLAGLVLLCCSACIYAKNPPTDPAAAPAAPTATETPTVVAPTTSALSPIDASTMTTTTPIVVAPTLVPDTTSETHALDAASVDPTTGNNTVGSPATTTPNADAVTGGGTLEDLD